MPIPINDPHHSPSHRHIENEPHFKHGSQKTFPTTFDAPAKSTQFETYLETWKGFEGCKAAIDKIRVNENTVFDLAFTNFDLKDPASGGLTQMPDEELKKLIDYIHEKGGKVKLSIGGATFQISDKEEKWKKLAEVIKNFNVNDKGTGGFDGVDLDVESVEGGHPEKIAPFIKDLKNALGDKKSITLTVPGGGEDSWLYKELVKNSINYVDHVSVMEYDSKTFSMDKIKKDIKEFIESWGIPPEKFSLGLMPTDGAGKPIMKLEDVIELAKWAKDQGYAGIMTWDLNKDFYEKKDIDYSNAIEDALFGK